MKNSKIKTQLFTNNEIVSKTVKMHQFWNSEEEVLEIIYKNDGMTRIELWSTDGKELLEAETLVDFAQMFATLSK
jgi:hypothetical protein